MLHDSMQLPSSGMILVNKPCGPTSHDIVDHVRRLTGIQRVGHAGTLDPFAQGLLIILIGKEWTKKQSEFLHLPKTYETEIILGAQSSTDDKTGEIHEHKNGSTKIELGKIKQCLESMIGSYAQLPPQYSAKKIQGTPAYKLARQGKDVKLQAKDITIYSLDLLSYQWPNITFRTHVSSGTYIRALARDIGEKLECGAYCSALKRTSIGDYKLEDALVI